MSSFQAVFYRDALGHEPVRDFLESLDEDSQAAIEHQIFAKRSARINHRDILTAQERWEDFTARMDAQPRVPPRAAGHDAP